MWLDTHIMEMMHVRFYAYEGVCFALQQILLNCLHLFKETMKYMTIMNTSSSFITIPLVHIFSVLEREAELIGRFNKT